MGVLVKEIEIIGDKGKAKVKALFDSGATDSLIRKDIAEKVATLLRMPQSLVFILGDGETQIQSDCSTDLQFIINNSLIPGWRFYVVDKMEEEIVIGADAFQRWKFKLDFEKEDVIIDKEALRLRLVMITTPILSERLT